MKIKSISGFSLVELLVVIAVIGVLSGITIMRIASPKYGVELESAGNTLQSELVKVRDLARAPQQGGILSDSKTTNGYGILLPTADTVGISISVYRDVIDNANPANQNKWVSSTGDTIVSTINLADFDLNNIKLLKYTVDDIDQANPGTRDIVFLSANTPTSESVFYNQSVNFTKAGIVLEHVITKEQIRIAVKVNGEIYIEKYYPTTLSINYSGNGSGTAVASPSASEYNKGTLVNITATPMGESTFTSWSGCDSVNGNICNVTMTGNKTVTASFSVETFALNIRRKGNGSGTSNYSSGAQIPKGSVVSLIATATNPSVFNGFNFNGGGCESNTNTCVFSMNKDETVDLWFNDYTAYTPNWISGPVSGIQVNGYDVTGLMWQRTSSAYCVAPQCSSGSLVSSNTVDFSIFPARDLCKAMGGRLPTQAQMDAILSNASSYGNNFNLTIFGIYWTNYEHSLNYGRFSKPGSPGGLQGLWKTGAENVNVRCIK